MSDCTVHRSLCRLVRGRSERVLWSASNPLIFKHHNTLPKSEAWIVASRTAQPSSSLRIVFKNGMFSYWSGCSLFQSSLPGCGYLVFVYFTPAGVIM